MATYSNANETGVGDVKLGDTIRFKTVSLRDTNVYSGTVTGIVDYERARIHGDVSATHLEMEQGASMLIDSTTGDPVELADVTQQQFLLVSLSGGELTPFAFEWVTSVGGARESVNLIEVGGTYTIRLYNVSSAEASVALSLLKSNGYVCKLTKKSSEE